MNAKQIAGFLLGLFGLIAGTLLAAPEYQGSICGTASSTDCRNCLAAISVLPSGNYQCQFMGGTTAQFSCAVCKRPTGDSTLSCNDNQTPSVTNTCTGMSYWICDTVTPGNNCDMTKVNCQCSSVVPPDGTGGSLTLNKLCS